MPHPMTTYGLPAAVVRMKFRAEERLRVAMRIAHDEFLAETTRDSVLLLKRAMEARDALVTMGDLTIASHPGDSGSGTVQ